jgi:hypothetical protein
MSRSVHTSIDTSIRLEELREKLNAPDRLSRVNAAVTAGELIRAGSLERTETNEVNNHVHTRYSFSPYSPARAAFEAWQAGLLTVGIMDHDSVAGAPEMLEACAQLGLAGTVGFEIRVNMNGTAVEGRRLNNPDSGNIAYIAIHAIPETRFDEVGDFLAPIQRVRNGRTERMVGALNDRLRQWGLEPLDFQRDVYELSEARDGGSITERHMLYALAQRLDQSIGRGTPMVRFLEERAGEQLSAKLRSYLEDETNPHYLYDLLGVFKSGLVQEIYIQPDYEECPNVQEVVDFARSIEAIPAYAYLGDIGESPTGDKAAAKYEDDYLDLLIQEIKRIGFQAVTYMPPRNTPEQIERIQALCTEHDLMQISGVDINSSRQSFNCPEIAQARFAGLRDAAFALVAHEKLAARGFPLSLAAEEERGSERSRGGPAAHPGGAPGRAAGGSFNDRVAQWGRVGRGMDHGNPDTVVEVAERILSEQT